VAANVDLAMVPGAEIPAVDLGVGYWEKARVFMVMKTLASPSERSLEKAIL
jgi:hypothetical protein